MYCRLVSLALQVSNSLYSLSGAAVTWHVDASIGQSGDGRSWETAFTTIQEGIDAASDGDTVIVAQGTYVENIYFKGKNVTVTSTDPLDPDIVATTIVDGDGAGSVVTFSGSESESCVLTGFSIRNGAGDAGGGICGGTYSERARAEIRNNAVVGNSATRGGGLAYCDGPILGNTITENSARLYGGGLCYCDGSIENNSISANLCDGSGGGLRGCHGDISDNFITDNWGVNGGGLSECGGTIHSNTIAQNSAEYSGGGLSDCDGTIKNNEIKRNWATSGDGGGLAFCDAVIEGNVIAENEAMQGGGLCYGETYGVLRGNAFFGNRACFFGSAMAWWHGPILNNTIAGNRSEKGAVAQCRGYIENCIIWGNAVMRGESLLYECEGAVAYSCIQDWTGGGDGNIGADPRFVDPDGEDDDPETAGDNDYRLLSESPCVDTGDNWALVPPGLDLDGNLRIAFGRHSLTVDMGAYEFDSVPFAITQLILGNGAQFELTWNSQPGDMYKVSSCADLLSGTWIKEADVNSQGAATSWTDGTPAGNEKFYRVEMR